MSDTAQVTNSEEIQAIDPLVAELMESDISTADTGSKRGRKPKIKLSKDEITANPEVLQEKMLIWLKDQLDADTCNDSAFLQTFATQFVGYVADSADRAKRLEIERIRLRMEALGIAPDDLKTTPTGKKKATTAA